MIYTLHHSKGTLLVAAEDREQVFRWSQRQLGNHARLVSIIEGDCTDADSTVEKDGTGITAREAEGCHPLMSIMANFAQDVPGEQGRSGCHERGQSIAQRRLKEPTWH